ncbi:hypothetical protein BS47DRAFT_1335302 [Hydnum rufescens UP504]|uniref:Uncharacterized protein n=1 Tax=Hydnum rufescens UP504 TaxID=1448309 RepID=A0A9P6BBC2_9AGAM|nr:hypothetical protein BS47DRAFT_1335302 [Hydnum rufescens UP504]
MVLRFLSYRSKYFPKGTLGLAIGNTVAPCTVLGRYVTDLYDVIENWDAVSRSLTGGTPQEDIAAVEILAPLRGRDVIGIAKNYLDHVKEIQKTPSATVSAGEPQFPMLFTKRGSSIIPHGAQIYHHSTVTNAHVWGATIINDISARDLQRDHKQFYIGKSLDTFCPMGPYAIPAFQLDWKNLMLETRVNGELRQCQNTTELIFDIPTLIETCSKGITLQPGDVIATGTPAGVGSSQKPPVFLKPGDKVEVTITELGTLSNVVAAADALPPSCDPVRMIPTLGFPTRLDSLLLNLPSGKRLYVHVLEPSDPNASANAPSVMFVHGIGESTNTFAPLIEASSINKTHRLVSLDLEGHGRSPLRPELQELSIDDFSESVGEVLNVLGIHRPVVLVSHSLGGLIATTFAAKYPSKVAKLFLIRPARPSIPELSSALISRAAGILAHGFSPSILMPLVNAGLSKKTRETLPLVASKIRSALVGTDLEGFARAFMALAQGTSIPNYENISAETMIIIGREDRMTPLHSDAEYIQKKIRNAQFLVLEDVGHWAHLEDWKRTAEEMMKFIGEHHAPSRAISARL